MVIKSLIATMQARLAARGEYRRAIAEIEALSEIDLLDLGTFQVDLFRAARREILG